MENNEKETIRTLMKSGEREKKGNTFSFLHSIFVLKVLSRRSSPEMPLTYKQVIGYLKSDYGIEIEATREKEKKISRILDTLSEEYPAGAVKKINGSNNRDPHKWYYDATLDKYSDTSCFNAKMDDEEGDSEGELSAMEIELLIDIVASSKILNVRSTHALIEKLIGKIDVVEDEDTRSSIRMTDEARRRMLERYKLEKWSKNPNDAVFSVERSLNDAILDCKKISFRYCEEEGGEEIFRAATPYEIMNICGVYYLGAVTDDGKRMLRLDCIADLSVLDEEGEFDDGIFDEFTDIEADGKYGELSLDSLFVNMQKISSAIKKEKILRFDYFSFVGGDPVTGSFKLCPEKKEAIPHSKVFKDGKYYLIATDAVSEELKYYRIDLMSAVETLNRRAELSGAAAAARINCNRVEEAESHPYMVEGARKTVVFWVYESAFDRVIDTFGNNFSASYVKDKLKYTDTNSGKLFRKYPDIYEDLFPNEAAEELLEVRVNTTGEEAFRWALSNADVVQLIGPQDLRDRLRNIAEPIRRNYLRSMADHYESRYSQIISSKRLEFGCLTAAFDTTKKFAERLSKEGRNGEIRTLCVNNAGQDVAAMLSAYENVRELCLEHCSFDDMSFMRSYKSLRKLSIRKCHIPDIKFLEDCPYVEKLSVVDTDIDDVSPIKALKELYSLSLERTGVKDISIIEELPYGVCVRLCENNIADISPITRARNVSYFYLCSNIYRVLDIDRMNEQTPIKDRRGIFKRVNLIEDGRGVGFSNINHSIAKRRG